MIDPQLHMLSSQSFPELAAALRSRSARVLDRWEQAVRESLTSVDEMTLTQLRDHLPLVIGELANALASDKPEATAEMDRAYRTHGAHRQHQHQAVDEVMAEYEILRRIVVEEVTDALGRGVTADEAVALHSGIDRATRRSVTAYVDNLAKQLKATDDLQSHYISFLNHDLRGGMNGILLMCEVLKRELSPDPKFAETTDDLDTMRRAVLDSVATMDRFVFAHRLSRGKHHARYGRFAIKPMVADLVSHLSHAAGERSVTFESKVADAVAVSSDRDMVRLILQSLLLNTIKHAKRGGGRATIDATPRPGGGGVILTVTD